MGHLYTYHRGINAGLRFKLPSYSTSPTLDVEAGQVIYDSTLKVVKYYNGSSFLTLSTGSGGSSGGLDDVYSNGQSITMDQGAIALADATAGADNILTLTKTGAGSGHLLHFDVDAALTGNVLDLDMNLGIASNAIYIDNGATARTGSDILVNSDSTDAHSVINIDASGSGAAVGFDYTGSYNGSPAGQAMKITFDNSDALDTEVMQVDTGTGNRGIMFDLNFGHADSGTTSHIFDIDIGGVLDSNVFDIAFSTTSTGNAIFINLDNAVGETALHIEGSGNRTQPMLEIATDATGSSNVVSIVITGAISGNVIDASLDTTVTGNFLDVDMNAAVGSKAIYIDAGAGTRTADLVGIKHDGDGNVDAFDITCTNTGTGSVFDINMNGNGSTGGVFNIDMDAAVGATVMTLDAGGGTRTVDMIDVTFDGDGNVGFLDLNCTNTGSGNLIDVDITGIHTGNVLDITYGTAASTGDAISVVMGTNVGGSALVITGAGNRTDDLIKIDDGSAGNSQIFDINITGNYTGNVLDIAFATGTATGNAINIATGTNVAGNAIAITTTGARSAPVIYVNGGGTDAGTDDHIIYINQTGQLDSDVLNITFGTAASTGQAIDINMGTNVAGMALSINSSGTGVSGEGVAIDVTHDGNLVAGADLVNITSTSDLSSTSNLLAIEQSTGAGTAGAYGLYISCTGTNVEAIKVDDGNVVLDENLSVGGTADITGAVTLTKGVQCAAVARTVTAAPGGTTGVIADGTSVVVVTSDDANKVLTLPTPTPGNIVHVLPNATGYELRSSTPASVAINGGTGANAESAVGANVLVVCTCTSATTWVCSTYAADGTEAKLEAAA